MPDERRDLRGAILAGLLLTAALALASCAGDPFGPVGWCSAPDTTWVDGYRVVTQFCLGPV